jgi:chemotaxis protein methyltransferase CheR
VPDAKRVYVFGCSDGCEAYSLAIHFRSHNMNATPSIMGFDINKDCIQKAKIATYQDRQLDYYGTGRASTGPRAEFFLPAGGDAYRVADSIAETCDFAMGDVLDSTFMSALPRADLVLCQNVLIHLTADQNRTAVNNLRPLVAEGGLLVLGGMRLDQRIAVAAEAGLEPVTENFRSIHDGWQDQRRGWNDSKPWSRNYRDLEPFQDRPDWQTRYSTIFRVAAAGRPSAAIDSRAPMDQEHA